MSWERVDWTRLERLRAGFLRAQASDGPYWRDRDDLLHYDFTFAQRIGWKWDAVLGELRARGWRPRGAEFLDWGCGSGVAARRFWAAYPQFKSILIYDHSALARDFAAQSLRSAEADARVENLERARGAETLLLSHVLNELGAEGWRDVHALLGQAREFVWVEAGTSAVSRALSQVRDELLAQGWRVLGPCTHARACPMLEPANARHWCHSFAPAPAATHHDAGWSLFARKLQIDLRRTPYAYLAMTRAEEVDERGDEAPSLDSALVPSLASPLAPGTATDLTRLIGDAREQKGLHKLLTCDGQRGVAETILQKRDDAELFRALRDPRARDHARIFRFHVEANKIKSGAAVHE